MKRFSLLTVLAVLAAGAASVISFQLLVKHLTGQPSPRWFEAGCSDRDGGTGCGKVLVSPYGYWPPKTEKQPEGATKPQDGTTHLPVAFFGLVYYSVLIVWLIGVGRPSYERRWLHLLPIGLVLLGLIASAYFVYIMAAVIDEWCLWCLTTHVLNLTITILLLLMWPRRPKTVPAVSDTPGRAPESSPALREPHPSFRLTLMTLGAAMVLALLFRVMLARSESDIRAARAAFNLSQCVDAVKQIQGDALKLFNNWNLAEKKELTIRADDPIRIKAKSDVPLLDVVVFSDFECPSCQRFAMLAEQRVLPLFDGNLRIIFKHHPLDNTCNKRVSSSMHPQACRAAATAEAARLLGGNDGFWKAHDFLFAHREALEKETLDIAPLLKELNVEGDTFMKTLGSPEIPRRVAEDISQAAAAEVISTPAIFVDGKRVDTLAWPELGFWDKLADHYWSKVAQTTRPAHTRPKPIPPAKATPDNRGQKDAP